MLNMIDDDVCVAFVVCEKRKPARYLYRMRIIFYYKFNFIIVTIKIIFVDH